MNDLETHEDIYNAAREILEKILELLEISATVIESHEFTVIDEDGTTSSVGLNIHGKTSVFSSDVAVRLWLLCSISSGLLSLIKIR